MNNYVYEGGTPTYVTTSGPGVIGISGKPANLLGVLVGTGTAPLVSLFTGASAATGTFALCTFAGNAFTRLPAYSPNGFSYNVSATAGANPIALTFFWQPAGNT